MSGAVLAAPRQGAPDNPTARVKWLAAATSASWLEQANAHPELVLIDHAHCERKAAGVALQLMFRYPSDEALGEALSPLAREELEHFELVLSLLQQRGIALRPLPALAYGSTLTAAVRRCGPERMLDSFLVAGLIEARSHERMALLAAHSPDPTLADLYSPSCWPVRRAISGCTGACARSALDARSPWRDWRSWLLWRCRRCLALWRFKISSGCTRLGWSPLSFPLNHCHITATPFECCVPLQSCSRGSGLRRAMPLRPLLTGG